MLYGNWWAPSLLLQIHPDNSMTAVTQKTYAFADNRDYRCLVYDVPVGDQTIQGALCKKCDPRSCFIDIVTGEEFFYQGGMRNLKPTLLIQHYTYTLTDPTHLVIEPVDGAIPESPAPAFTGQVEFSASDDTLTLRSAAEEPLILTQDCGQVNACWLTAP